MFMTCNICCLKDEFGNFIEEDPCCSNGHCTAAYTECNSSICVCCGAEMFKEHEIWWHWSQESIPLHKRFLIHHMENKRT